MHAHIRMHAHSITHTRTHTHTLTHTHTHTQSFPRAEGIYLSIFSPLNFVYLLANILHARSMTEPIGRNRQVFVKHVTYTWRARWPLSSLSVVNAGRYHGYQAQSPRYSCKYSYVVRDSLTLCRVQSHVHVLATWLKQAPACCWRHTGSEPFVLQQRGTVMGRRSWCHTGLGWCLSQDQAWPLEGLQEKRERLWGYK